MRRVLIVDDEVDLLLALSVLLQSSGYQVFEARTGAGGLAAAEREKPDVVILDVGLPDVSGVEVLRQLRERGTQAAILVLSAHASRHTERSAAAEGADAYVTKPFNPDELLQTLDRLLG
ncbi:MAG: response regulator [Actinomycetota bacterium]|nr:response regulator [Actinomycetota bacterium]